MPDFYNFDELFNYIEENTSKKDISTALENVGKDIKEQVKDEIQGRLYDANDNQAYVRTFDFLESVASSNVFQYGDEFSVSIYYDIDKMRTEYDPSGGIWNQHMSYSGQDMRQHIPHWLEYGTPDDGKNWYPRHGIQAMPSVYLRLQNGGLKKGMLQHLRNLGYKVSGR